MFLDKEVLPIINLIVSVSFEVKSKFSGYINLTSVPYFLTENSVEFLCG